MNSMPENISEYVLLLIFVVSPSKSIKFSSKHPDFKIQL